MALRLHCHQAAPNAQLRSLNPMVRESQQDVACAFAIQLTPGVAAKLGGVSSFGYSGTICHGVLCTMDEHLNVKAKPPRVYQRREYPYTVASHPFSQRLQSNSQTRCSVSPTAGALHAIVADHIIQGRIFFPAAAYLEMARATAHALSISTSLTSVFFLHPLVVEVIP